MKNRQPSSKYVDPQAVLPTNSIENGEGLPTHGDLWRDNDENPVMDIRTAILALRDSTQSLEVRLGHRLDSLEGVIRQSLQQSLRNECRCTRTGKDSSIATDSTPNNGSRATENSAKSSTNLTEYVPALHDEGGPEDWQHRGSNTPEPLSPTTPPLFSKSNTKSSARGEKIALHDAWNWSSLNLLEIVRSKGSKPSVNMEAAEFAVFGREFKSMMGGEMAPSAEGTKRWVMHPNSTKRLIWDVVGMLLILYDVIVIPLNIGFQPEEGDFLFTMLLVTTIFWSIDINLTFVTAYYENGKLEVHHRKIAKHYLKTWFFIDVPIVSLDWFLITIRFLSDGLADSDAGVARLGRTFRAFRILRSMRLLRIVKLKKLIEELYDRVSSEYVHICIEIVRLLVIIVTINHFVACVWYGIGTEGWVAKQGYTDDDLNVKYITALHWSLTQMTPASMEIHPESLPERVMAVIVVLLGVVMFSSFVSSMTAAVSRMRSLSMETQQQFWKLRRYLKEHEISADLTARINRYLEYKIQKEHTRIKADEVVLLKQLSIPLRMQMETESHVGVISTHPFFHMYGQEDPQALRHLCYNAISRIWLSKGDDLFAAGTVSSCLYFVVRGPLRYFRIKSPAVIGEATASSFGSADCLQNLVPNPGAQNSCAEKWCRLIVKLLEEVNRKTPRLTSVSNMEVKDLNAGEWCCEACLWVPWVHKGTLRATAIACELLTINAQKFQNLTLQHDNVRSSAITYAREFLKWLTDDYEDHMSDLDTLEDAQQRVRLAYGLSVSLRRSMIREV